METNKTTETPAVGRVDKIVSGETIANIIQLRGIVKDRNQMCELLKAAEKILVKLAIELDRYDKDTKTHEVQNSALYMATQIRQIIYN